MIRTDAPLALDRLHAGRYCILQVLNGEQWVDFATITDEVDLGNSVTICNNGFGDTAPNCFRIVPDGRQGEVFYGEGYLAD